MSRWSLTSRFGEASQIAFTLRSLEGGVARTGRPPKSLEAHAREGTVSQVGRSRGAKPPVVPALVAGRGKVEAPAGLDETEAAVFAELAEHVAALTDVADASWVEGATMMLLRARQARADIRRNGIVMEVVKRNRSGEEYSDVVTNPMVRVERDAWAAFRQYAEQLGIGPSARAKLAGVGDGREPGDEFDELSDEAEQRELRVLKGGKRN
jgi:P27 family predicted phage terminase small subunit